MTKVAGAVDALAVAERFERSLAERDSDILDGVVLVDVEVTGGAERQVEATVPGKQLQHVIEKPDPGADVVSPAAIKHQPSAYMRFSRTAIECRRAAPRFLHSGCPDPPRTACSRTASRGHDRLQRFDGGFRVLDDSRRHANATRA